MNERYKLSPWGRLSLAAFGLGCAVLLATAWRLTPDPRGFGTHEQLGLARCGFAYWTGWPCPTCGMTTAWAFVLNGNLNAALAANAGGALLCLASLLAAPWAIASAIAARRIGRQPPFPWALWIATAWMAVTLLDWARRVVAG